MDEPEKNPALELLVMTVVGSFIEAVFFVIVFTFSLPATDGAYGSMPFSDPFVAPVMSAGALASAVLLFPFALWLLREVQLERCFGRLLVPGLLVLGVLTPLLNGIGIPGVVCVPLAWVATIVAMFSCRKRFPSSTTAAPSWRLMERE